MKKLLTILMSLLLVLSIAGCSSSTPPTTETPGPDTTEGPSHTIVEVDATKVEDLIQTDPDLVIIDVSGKWAEGHIVGALDTPIDKLQEIIQESFTLNPSKNYVVYAHDEETSKKAAQMLLDNSFSSVSRLTGGYDAWVANGGYTEK